MQKYSKLLMGVVIALAIVAVGVLVGWWGSRGTAPEARPTPTKPASVVKAVPTNHLPPAATSVRSSQNAELPPATNPLPAAVAGSPNAGSANLITNWQPRVDDVLGSDDDNSNKVNQLFALFPRVPASGQSEVAQHLANLVPNDDYAPLAKLLENPKLPENVLDELMSDALNRPNSMKLPVLLKVAETPDHPKAGEAKDLLELYLDADYGTNWSQWRQGVQDWLKNNPD